MKEYDLIAIGSGSAMNIVNAVIQQNPEMKVAVIDKDDPGGDMSYEGLYTHENIGLSG